MKNLFLFLLLVSAASYAQDSTRNCRLYAGPAAALSLYRSDPPAGEGEYTKKESISGAELSTGFLFLSKKLAIETGLVYKRLHYYTWVKVQTGVSHSGWNYTDQYAYVNLTFISIPLRFSYSLGKNNLCFVSAGGSISIAPVLSIRNPPTNSDESKYKVANQGKELSLGFGGRIKTKNGIFRPELRAGYFEYAATPPYPLKNLDLQRNFISLVIPYYFSCR